MSSRSIIEIHVPECVWEWPALTNELVLVLSISLFLIFAIAELFGALASDSLSLLGDSICMFVDVSSYICNTYVEWYKARNGRVTFGSRIFTEIIVPALSVLSLLGVTVYITVDAVAVVKTPSISNTVNVNYLYAYSIANLIVDIICNFLFFVKGENAFLEESVEIPKLSLDTSIDIDDEVEFGRLEDDQLMCDNHNSLALRRAEANSGCSLVYRFFRFYCCGFCTSACHWPSMSAHDASHQSDHSQQHHPGHSYVHKSNLNMLSAFSHVLGDTFRTVSTLLAAIVSTASGINGEICDAWAAIAVSITIVLFCALLLWEIKEAALDIWEEDFVEIGTGIGDGNSAANSARAKIAAAYVAKSVVGKQQHGPRQYDNANAVGRDGRSSGAVHSYQRVAETDEDIIM
jgi:cation diffusion facilitator family transporter